MVQDEFIEQRNRKAQLNQNEPQESAKLEFSSQPHIVVSEYSPPSGRLVCPHWRGLLFRSVFIDYHNTYRSARSIYHEDIGPHMLGQVDPGALGRLLVDRGPDERQLVEVRVYRGLPSSKHDPKAYGAARAQLATWERNPLVSTVTRPLRYPIDYPASPAEEKGVDVSLAVDLVMGAAKGVYDVGIVMSLDTDLRPAIETVMNDLHGIRVEVAAFNRPDRHCPRLSIAGTKLWCHWIQPDDYAQVTDEHDYRIGARSQ